MVINWRERFIAAGIHFLVTLLLAALAAALIFYVWFPGAFATMIGGTTLFLMVVGIDVALGPLISLIIFNSKKPRRELVIDYTVIGAVQIAALVYGVFTLAASRPVFVVFHGERLEIVRAIELEDEDLAQGVAPEFRSLSWFGPRLAAVEMPTNIEERNNLVFSAAAGGKDAEKFPKYYRAYRNAHEQIAARSRTLDTLQASQSDRQAEISNAIESISLPAGELRWLPVRHRFGYAVAIVNAKTMEPVKYLAVEPKY